MNVINSHLLYIPAIFLIGGVIGFILGRLRGIKEGQDHYLGEGES